MFGTVLYCLLLFSICCFAGTDSTKKSTMSSEIADSAINGLSTISSNTDDILMNLNKVNGRGAFFLKVMVPVGSLIAGELNPKSGSDIYNQLIKLKERTNKIWEQNQLDINISIHAVQTAITFDSYSKKVTLPLRTMLRMTETMTDPTTTKTAEYAENFKESCQYGEKQVLICFLELSPGEILDFLELHLVDKCTGSGMTKSEIEQFAAQRAWVVNASLRMRVKGEDMPTDLDVYTMRFREIFKNSVYKSKFDLDRINALSTEFNSYEEAFNVVFEELSGSNKNLVGIEDCFLRELMLSTNFNNGKVDAYALQLKDELIYLLHVTAICSNMTCDGKEEQMRLYENGIRERIDSIASNSSNWLNSSLINSWPEVHFQVVREKLVQQIPEPGQVTQLNLINTIATSLPVLDLTGPKNYIHQLLIARMADQEIYAEGLDEFCAFKGDINGFNLLVSRIQVNTTDIPEIERIKARLLSLFYRSLNLNATYQSEMPSLYNAGDLKKLMTDLKQKFGQIFIAQDYFHCVSFLRVYAPIVFKACPSFEYARKSYGYNDFNGPITLKYRFNGSLFHVCEDYHLHLLI